MYCLNPVVQFYNKYFVCLYDWSQLAHFCFSWPVYLLIMSLLVNRVFSSWVRKSNRFALIPFGKETQNFRLSRRRLMDNFSIAYRAFSTVFLSSTRHIGLTFESAFYTSFSKMFSYCLILYKCLSESTRVLYKCLSYWKLFCWKAAAFPSSYLAVVRQKPIKPPLGRSESKVPL